MSERIDSKVAPMAVEMIEIRLADAKRRNQQDEASNHTEDASDATGEETDLCEIISGCQQKSIEHMHLLYCHFCRTIYSLMVRIVGQQDANDLTQQVFLKIFQSIHQFAGRSRFSTWLHRLALNEALQHLRRQKRRQQASLVVEPVDNVPGHERAQESKELLEQSLSQLDPALRSIFLLREVEGFSYEAIASVLGIPEGTVGSRLNRARRELQGILRELGWEPDNDL